MVGYGDVVLTAFREVENGLTNESLLAQRLQFEKKALSDRAEAVRISKLQYEAGEIDLLSVLQLQEYQITTQGNLITLSNAQLANRINLHLANGGGFLRDTLTRFMGLIVLSMGVQFALTGYRAFMK